MSLKDVINNTNKQKENIKTVKNKINNKLVKCGGQEATDLNDIPEQIQKMLDRYKGKRAIKNLNLNIMGIKDFNTHSYSMSINLAFKPTLAILQITKQGAKEWEGIIVQSDLNNTLEKANTDGQVKIYIDSVDELFANIVVKSIAAYTGDYVLKRGIFLE